MSAIEFFKVGDYVIVDNSVAMRQDIGRIVEIIEPSNTFSYILFVKPEETHCGRLSYHGKNEIFKTNTNNEESISQIVSKVEVIKLQDYSKIAREEKFASDLFVCRQKYDTEEARFIPELEPDCFCNRILNPDEDLLLCECERLFHLQCVTGEQTTCPTCENSLVSLGEAIYKKRKLEEDHSILLKSNEDEFYEIFANALDNVAEEKEEKSNYRSSSYKNANDKRPISCLAERKNANNKPNPRAMGTTNKKPMRKELTNITDEAYDNIKHAIDNFSKAHQNKNMADLDRSRYFIKEKYYKCLLYGIEEVKEKQRIAGSYHFLSEGARKIALRDTRENYKNAQTLALNIEAVIWHVLNKNKTRMDPNYSMKNRELLNYLMDDNNFELRLAVLVGEKSPEFLCQASGKELVSKEISKKIEKKEESTLKLSLLPNDVKIVTKSHKGEMVIEAPNPEPQTVEPVKEPEVVDDEMETVAELVQKIERKNSEGSGFDDFEFVKQNKKTKKNMDDDSLSESSNSLIGNNFKGKISSTTKTPENTMMKAVANRMIDQQVLKNVTNFFFDPMYSKIAERLRAHLKPEIANDILMNVNPKYQND